MSGIEPLTSSLRKRCKTKFQQLSKANKGPKQRETADENPYCSLNVPLLFPQTRIAGSFDDRIHCESKRKNDEAYAIRV
jgi:hypothetical protein